MAATPYLDGRVLVHAGDCREVIAELADNSIDAVVTDPPYALVSISKRFGKEGAAPAKHGTDGAYARASAGFMGKQWDTGEAAFAVEFWAQVYRVLKPGGHVLAFGGTRTYHRLVCAIEDAGFEIRDQIGWAYGSGFPKSHDASKGIDRHLGVEREITLTGKPVKRMIPGADQNKGGWEKNNGREYVPGTSAPATSEAAQWEGWGTALKPAWEPIVVARKPLDGTIAQNLLKWGTGALNIDGCRIEGEGNKTFDRMAGARARDQYRMGTTGTAVPSAIGRWPANVIHDGSDEVLAAFPDAPGQQRHSSDADRTQANVYGATSQNGKEYAPRNDEGSAARFFYTAKADAEDRLGSKHPTVKPLDLMQYLVRLVTPPRVSFCPQCEGKSDDREAGAGAGEGVRSLPEDVQTTGQPAHGEVLQSAVRGSGARAQAEGVRVVRNDVSAEEGRGAAILHADVRGEVERQEPDHGHGVRDEQGGLSAPVDAGAPASSSAERLRVRAPLGDAAEDRSVADQGRGGSPHQRAEGGQSPGELGADAQGGPRQAEPASAEHAVLSALPGNHHHEPTCTHCGYRLSYRPGVVLDPFAGTGTTGEAAFREGMRAILIEREAEYLDDIARRMDLAHKPTKRAAVAKTKNKLQGAEGTPLFGGGE